MRVALLNVFLLAVAIAAPVYAAQTGDTSQASRQVIVHAKGAHVMPFDLDKTQHIFKQTVQGGVEEVIARNPQDTQQIALIRMHLKHEAQRFAAGDFSDPAAIHGENMPGLQPLAAGARHISFVYANLPDGASITYTTRDPTLGVVLHEWFKAQSMDHGHDAMP